MGTEESGDIMRDPEFHKRTLGALIAALTFATAAVSCSSKVSNDKNTSEVQTPVEEPTEAPVEPETPVKPDDELPTTNGNSEATQLRGNTLTP